MKSCRILLIFAWAGSIAAQNGDAQFIRLADRFFDEVQFRYDPAQATAQGFHQYDGQLPSVSRAEIQGQVAALKKWEAEVHNFDERGLSAFVAADRQLLLSEIQSLRFNLETLRFWEKNPDVYSSGATNAIFVIISRRFAPPTERLKSVLARTIDPALAAGGAREPHESAQGLHRNCAPTTAGDGRFFPKGRAGGLPGGY